MKAPIKNLFSLYSDVLRSMEWGPSDFVNDKGNNIVELNMYYIT